MRVLLPPSEAKTPGGRGRSLAQRPPHPTLGEARATTFGALATLLAQGRDAASAALLLPPSVVDDVLATNSVAQTSRTMPALHRYAGVVYDGLDLASLSTDEQRLAGRELYVFSGLLGVVRGDEPVPDYRVPAKAALPGIGIAGTFWRAVLDGALPPLLGRGVVIDLRSSDYAAMWRPARSDAHRVVSVRVLSRLPSGRWGVISYNSKFAKGRLAAALVRRRAGGRAVSGADDVVAAWQEATGLPARCTSANAVEVYTDAH